MFQEKVISAAQGWRKKGVAGFARFCPNESFVELKAQTYRF